MSIAAILLATLFALSFLAERAGHSGLMLVIPTSGAIGQIALTTAERLRDEGLLLTYEISSHAAVEALNSRHSAILIGTNSTYLDITGHRLISGGFFTQSAWDGQSRVATLNESAAFAIFGGTNIDGLTISIGGQPWTVVGVIDDGQKDNLNIYVPSSVGGGDIRSFMILMPDGSGHAYVVNTLGGFGIREGEYDFINLSRVAGVAGERFSVAWKIAACLATILLGAKVTSFVRKIYLACKQELVQYYPRELLARRRADIAKAGVALALLAGGIAAALNLSLQVLATTLRWQEISLPVWYPSADFAYKLAWLRDFHTVGTWVFSAYLLTTFAVATGHIITAWGKSSG
ncbi:MAG: ABC transporter permease [Oscillospiraceae bacterium]|nr:ABC transporter permease [Oscillospiraceae bacterium]